MEIVKVQNINAYPFLYDRLIAFENMVNNGNSRRYLQNLSNDNKFNLSMKKSVTRFLDDLLTDLNNTFFPSLYMRGFKALNVAFVLEENHASTELQKIFKVLALFDSKWNGV